MKKKNVTQSASARAARSNLHEVMIGRSGGKGAHRPKSQKKAKEKLRKFIEESY